MPPLVPSLAARYDMGSAYDPSYFETFFAEAESGGQNSARFWVHCDGRDSPAFAGPAGQNSSVVGLASGFLDNLVDLVSRGKEHGILVYKAAGSSERSLPCCHRRRRFL